MTLNLYVHLFSQNPPRRITSYTMIRTSSMTKRMSTVQICLIYIYVLPVYFNFQYYEVHEIFGHTFYRKLLKIMTSYL